MQPRGRHDNSRRYRSNGRSAKVKVLEQQNKVLREEVDTHEETIEMLQMKIATMQNNHSRELTANASTTRYRNREPDKATCKRGIATKNGSFESRKVVSLFP